MPLTGYEPVDDETLLLRAEAAYQALANRRSLRAFSDRPVARAVIEQCLLAAVRRAARIIGPGTLPA